MSRIAIRVLEQPAGTAFQMSLSELDVVLGRAQEGLTRALFLGEQKRFIGTTNKTSTVGTTGTSMKS